MINTSKKIKFIERDKYEVNILEDYLTVILKSFLIFLIIENFYHSSVRKTRNIFYNHRQTHSECNKKMH